MGLLAKLLGRPEPAESSPATGSETCTHLALTPRWESVDDIGHEDLATGFHCESCGRDFSAEEARELRSSEGNRVRFRTPPQAMN
ncbi:MAG TPA: hypothetical protein VK821_07515 [Dehalococcoidia bacterium]|nr:hypothetical protein [Dehalococcoidia bacterium]